MRESEGCGERKCERSKREPRWEEVRAATRGRCKRDGERKMQKSVYVCECIFVIYLF